MPYAKTTDIGIERWGLEPVHGGGEHRAQLSLVFLGRLMKEPNIWKLASGRVPEG